MYSSLNIDNFLGFLFPVFLRQISLDRLFALFMLQ